VADTRDAELDPRYPTAFQRGGPSLDETPVASAAPRASRAPTAATPVLDDGVAVTGATAPARAESTERTAHDSPHFEIVVAGNPWLRSLWVVGALALAAGIALTVYGEFAFSIAPANGIYDPSTYVLPRIAQMLALPLSIAGVVALTAAACLRIVAWRPSGARVADE